ncbi:MAG: DUF6788 family protein [Bacteroidota bacterium]|nr:DUF6788 family protein [Bacteroidota bacterium]
MTDIIVYIIYYPEPLERILMEHRGRFTQKDRQARSKLAKLAGNKRLLCGSLVTMARVCGNPRCKCATKGQKHVSLYLSIRDGKKRKMICIPKKWESTIGQWVGNYKRANELMAEISASSLKRFMEDED